MVVDDGEVLDIDDIGADALPSDFDGDDVLELDGADAKAKECPRGQHFAPCLIKFSIVLFAINRCTITVYTLL